MHARRWWLNLLLTLPLVGCGGAPSPAPNALSKPAKLVIAELPVKLTVNQRSTTQIPGSDGELLITVDDVTRGQTMVSIVRTGAATLMGPVSMKDGDSKNLQIDGTVYTLQLTQLNNELVGEDTASFSIDSPTDNPTSESEKIERLIRYVHAMEGAVFIRNGEEHTPKEAAEHLRTKLNAGGGDLQTARDFIEQIASRSSLTGEVYQIRTAEGRTMPAEDVLREQLAQMEGEE